MRSIKKIEPVKARSPVRKTRVAAYCRVSTGSEEQLVSLEAQKKHYEDTITADPTCEFAGLYYDEGITGTKKEIRPALMRMMADCEAGLIDRIVTKSLSRFARNTTDCLELVRGLKYIGVSVFFEKENLDTGSMDSELLLSVMSSLAESESVSISENEKWGIRKRFESGTYKIGSAPYGYSVKDGVFSVNEEEAKWVRWIFAQALAGRSGSAIAKELTAKGVPSRKAGKWNATSVRGILRNEKYTGDCLFQKTYSDFRFKRHTNRGDRNQYYMAEHHDAIVSHEDFEAAGKMIEQRAKEKNVRKGEMTDQKGYPFTGKIVCGNCGTRFKRKVCYTGSAKYAVWVCGSHLNDPSGCPVKQVREDELENAFTTMMNKLIFAQDKIIPAIAEGLKKDVKGDVLCRVSEIEEKIEKNAERRQTLTAIMAKGYIEPALFMQENNELNAEAERLEAEKKSLMREAGSNAKLESSLDELARYVSNAEPETGFNKDLADRFLERITIDGSGTAVFRLKCGIELKERIG